MQTSEQIVQPKHTPRTLILQANMCACFSQADHLLATPKNGSEPPKRANNMWLSLWLLLKPTPKTGLHQNRHTYTHTHPSRFGCHSKVSFLFPCSKGEYGSFVKQDEPTYPNLWVAHCDSSFCGGGFNSQLQLIWYGEIPVNAQTTKPNHQLGVR